MDILTGHTLQEYQEQLAAVSASNHQALINQYAQANVTGYTITPGPQVTGEVSNDGKTWGSIGLGDTWLGYKFARIVLEIPGQKRQEFYSRDNPVPESATSKAKEKEKPRPWIPRVDDWDLLPDA